MFKIGQIVSVNIEDSLSGTGIIVHDYGCGCCFDVRLKSGETVYAGDDEMRLISKKVKTHPLTSIFK